MSLSHSTLAEDAFQPTLTYEVFAVFTLGQSEAAFQSSYVDEPSATDWREAQASDSVVTRHLSIEDACFISVGSYVGASRCRRLDRHLARRAQSSLSSEQQQQQQQRLFTACFHSPGLLLRLSPTAMISEAMTGSPFRVPRPHWRIFTGMRESGSKCGCTTAHYRSTAPSNRPVVERSSAGSSATKHQHPKILRKDGCLGRVALIIVSYQSLH